MSTKTRFLIKAFITLALLAAVVYRLDLAVLVEVIASLSLPLLMGAVALQATSVLVATTRWRVILQNFDIRTPYRPLVRIAWIGFFFNLFLPSGIGGDFFRAYYLAKREDRGMSTTLTTTVLERSAGLLALLLIGLTASIFGDIGVDKTFLILIFSVLLLAYTAANVAIFHPAAQRLLARLMARLKRQDLDRKIELVTQGMSAIRKNPRALILSATISLVVQLLSVLVIWCAAHAIHMNAPLPVFLTFVPLINLTIMIPITINGLGLRESLYALLFQQIGVSTEAAVTLSLMHFFVSLIASLPGGLAYSLYKRDEQMEQVFSQRNE